jgi:6-pyruvoyltetrahydropterin/6-carboxytetrahydropterin synthase
LDKDLKFIGQKKDLIENRTGYSISKLLDFLKIEYEYNNSFNDSDLNIDFKIGDKYIKIIEDDSDKNEFRIIKERFPLLDLIAIGKSSYLGKINEMDSMFMFDKQSEQIGSIFIEDPSLAFDYAHILPLVEKCSIIHGHTSTIMVEIIGSIVSDRSQILHQ